MSTTAIIEEPKFEVLPPDVTTASTELSCPADKVAALYQPFEKPFQAAADLLAKEEAITTAFDARTLRLQMVKARTTITATKDESKSDIKLAANIIDWFHAKGRDRLAAAEARLLDVEKAEERKEAARLEAIREERQETLDSMGHVSHGINLGSMSDDAWNVYLQQAKDVYEMRQIRKKRETEEAAAELARQEAEREAARLEAIRLREEAEAHAAAAKAEREAREKEQAEANKAAYEARKKAEAELAEQKAKAKAEREKLEAAAEAERREFLRVQLENSRKQAEADAAAKAEREKLEEEKRVAHNEMLKRQEQTRLDHEAAMMKARAEAAAKEREREKAEAEAKALRDAEAKRIADEKAKEAAQAKADAAAVKKAAAAPDKTRLLEFAIAVRNMPVPPVKSEIANEVRDDITAKLESFSKWIEATVSVL